MSGRYPKVRRVGEGLVRSLVPAVGAFDTVDVRLCRPRLVRDAELEHQCVELGVRGDREFASRRAGTNEDRWAAVREECGVPATEGDLEVALGLDIQNEDVAAVELGALQKLERAVTRHHWELTGHVEFSTAALPGGVSRVTGAARRCLSHVRDVREREPRTTLGRFGIFPPGAGESDSRTSGALQEPSSSR